jgi:hypothetical protein
MMEHPLYYIQWATKEVPRGCSEKLNWGHEEEIGPPLASCTAGSLYSVPQTPQLGLPVAILSSA